MARKALNRSQLTKKLDKVFSQFIRLEGADNSWVSCVTCGSKHYWKEIHAGHFITRGCRTTRWDEMNVHPQCCGCNTYRFGEQAKMLLYIESNFGRSEVDRIMQLEKDYKSGNYIKLSLPEMREKIEYYKEQVKALE